MRPTLASSRSVLGWFWLTPFEIGLLVLIVWLTLRGAWPRYGQWRVAGKLQDEQYVVSLVRSALAGPDTLQRSCPASLDTCRDGSTGEDCAFFANVLPTRPSLAGWRKQDGLYRGPAGGWYRYDGPRCQFLPASSPGNAP